MANGRSFNPDYYLPPGDILEEILEENSMSQTEFAKRAGLSTKHVNEIIKGKAGLTPDTSLQFEKVLGIPASFWINFESQYREALAREKQLESFEKSKEWLEQIPVKKMIAYGWVKKCKSIVDQMNELLDYFRVASPRSFDNLCAANQVKFRISTAMEINKGAVAAWLRQGEILAEEIDYGEFRRDVFKGVLPEIRKLTLETPDIFVPKLKDICASKGVALVFVKELPKTGLSGATRFINDKALMQLSLRYKTNDHLWFSFFHEAAHLIYHGKNKVYLESVRTGRDISSEEKEANVFASNILIPTSDYNRIKQVALNSRLSKAEIINFANSIDIHPGIVVGRLQHDELLNFNNFNDLKDVA